MTKELEDAIKVLTEAIKTDTEYRRGWQANIAMAFKDECRKIGNLHTEANSAATRFLSHLCETDFEVL